MIAHTDGNGEARTRRLLLAGLLLLTVLLGSRGLRDESSVMLGGDMARYVMNGVFVHDLVADGGAWSFDELVHQAERYYARYPALSLGHHPPLPYFALVPFYAVFGISILAARLAAVAWFVLAAWAVYTLTRRLFGWQAASWATALFATNLVVLRSGQSVLSEMPMVALVLVSLNAVLRYSETGRTKHFVWFAMAVVASLFAKQLAISMLPVYGVILITRRGWRDLTRRRAVVAIGISGALVLVLAIVTFHFAPSNVDLAMRNLTGLVTGTRSVSAGAIIRTIVTTHLSLPALLVTITGIIALLVRRNRDVAVGLTWIAAVLGATVGVAGGTEPARYASAALPAYFVLAGALAREARTGLARASAVTLLSVAVIWQVWMVRDVRPAGAGGYEAAARYAVDHAREPAVVYDGAVDTGYFVFFVRKHDPERRLIVLRADKLWPAPPDHAPPADDAVDPERIYDVLRRLGVRFIVVEAPADRYRLLRTLHDELETPRFIERQRIPIISSAMQDRDLVIYEFLQAQPAELDTELNIGIPVGNREITLRLRDLVETGVR